MKVSYICTDARCSWICLTLSFHDVTLYISNQKSASTDNMGFESGAFQMTIQIFDV